MPREPGTWHANEHSVPPTRSEEWCQLEPELALWSKFGGAQAALVTFFVCLCDYCVLVFLCYWESINYTRLMNLKCKRLLMLRLVSWTQKMKSFDLCFLGKCFEVTSALLLDLWIMLSWVSVAWSCNSMYYHLFHFRRLLYFRRFIVRGLLVIA